MSNEPKKNRRQTHQNKAKFYHNPNSVLTARIAAIEHSCICDRCDAQIQWRKDYRKYKPLKEMRRCNICSNKNINRAYHTICEECARATGLCAKCNDICEASEKPKAVTDEMVLHTIENSCSKERYKRSIMRNWERGALSNENALLLILSGDDGKELNWQDYAQEGEGLEDESSDDDAKDMGVKPKKKIVVKTATKADVEDEQEEKARVIRAADVDDLGTVAVTKKLKEFKI